MLASLLPRTDLFAHARPLYCCLPGHLIPKEFFGETVLSMRRRNLWTFATPRPGSAAGPGSGAGPGWASSSRGLSVQRPTTGSVNGADSPRGYPPARRPSRPGTAGTWQSTAGSVGAGVGDAVPVRRQSCCYGRPGDCHARASGDCDEADTRASHRDRCVTSGATAVAVGSVDAGNTASGTPVGLGWHSTHVPCLRVGGDGQRGDLNAHSHPVTLAQTRDWGHTAGHGSDGDDASSTYGAPCDPKEFLSVATATVTCSTATEIIVIPRVRVTECTVVQQSRSDVCLSDMLPHSRCSVTRPSSFCHVLCCTCAFLLIHVGCFAGRAVHAPVVPVAGAGTRRRYSRGSSPQRRVQRAAGAVDAAPRRHRRVPQRPSAAVKAEGSDIYY